MHILQYVYVRVCVCMCVRACVRACVCVCVCVHIQTARAFDAAGEPASESVASFA